MSNNKKMIIFEVVKKYLISLDLNVNERPLHRKQLLRISINFFTITPQCIYLVNDANTARDYMSFISIVTIGILVHICYCSVIFETETIYDFIDSLEAIINRSEFEIIVYSKCPLTTKRYYV